MGAVRKLKQVETRKPSETVDYFAKKLAAQLLDLDWSKNGLYQRWINEHFHLVRRTMRYINLGAGLSEVTDDKTYYYWIHHLKEENNHHKVLEKDAERFGLCVANSEPLPITKALVSVIYNGMIGSSGIYLFGYGSLLEGLACHAAARIADQVEAKFEKGSAKFLRLHADVDDGEDGHYLAMKNHMDSLPEPQQELIREAIEVNYALYSEMIRQISGR
jgi:hypothetical protein